MTRQFRKYILGDSQNTYSIHKLSQTNLLLNFATMLVLAGGIVLGISLIIGTHSILYPAIGNIVLALIVLTILKYGQVRVAAAFYFISLFILLFGNIIFNDGVMHIGSPFWIMLLNILVMYILGIRWGIVFVIASILGFGYYIIFVLDTSLQIMNDLPPKIYYSAVYETVIALVLLSYVVGSILKTSSESDIMLQTQNNDLRSRNEEKKVMLQEIHHRVKNNLQVIVSLMRLKMHEVNDANTLEQYQDTINRVMAMAKIHEKIYQSNSINKVDLEEYFEDLTRDLLHTYETDKKVNFTYDIRVDHMDLDNIVPLALIFNELFSNSLEHAFESVDRPHIQLDLVAAGGRLHFQYEDNGIWKENPSSNSFGLELIDTLVNQLDGKMTFEKKNSRYELNI